MEDKERLVQELSAKTGFPVRRCKNYFERFNWNKERVYEYPVIKSALREEEPLFDFDDIVEEKPKEEVKSEPKRKTRKRKSKKSDLTDETLSFLDTNRSNIRVTDFDVKYEVETVNGQEYFRGKEIRMNSSGFYHPYPKMSDIVEWTQKFLRK